MQKHDRLRVVTTRHLAPDTEAISTCADLLASGELVVVPTETVYGLAANAFDERAVAGIFEAKGRPQDNPVIVHIAGVSQLDKVAVDIDGASLALARQFWPGPLTIVLRKAAAIAPSVSAGLPTVGVRVPAHEACLRVLEMAGLPLAAPSANRSGRPSPTNFAMAVAEMEGRVAAILDGGPCEFGLESTIVSALDGSLRILRPGAIGPGHLRRTLDAAGFGDMQILVGGEQRAPGTRHPHYRPAAEVRLYESAAELESALAGMAKERRGPVGIMVPLGEVRDDFSRIRAALQRGPETGVYESPDLAAYARNLYSDLVRHEAVSSAPVFMYLPPEKAGSGSADPQLEALRVALRDRILRAAGRL